MIDPPFPDWDQWLHLGDAVDAYGHLTGGSIKGLLLYLDAPVQYPFVHNLLVALSWLVAGVSLEVARGASLLVTVVLASGMVALARTIPLSRAPHTTAAVAIALTLSAREVAQIQGLVMLEITGMAVTVWAVVAYLRWLRDGGLASSGLLVASLLAAFFTKYNYGVVLGLALAVHAVLTRPPRGGVGRVLALMLGPVLLWLYQEPVKKMSILLEVLSNRQVDKSIVAQLLFPLETLVMDCALWLPIGGLVLALSVAAFRIVPVRQPVGVLLVLPLVQALAQAASVSQSPRYVLPAVPLLHLAVASVVVDWFGGSIRRHRWLGLLAVGLVAPLALAPQIVSDRFYFGVYERIWRPDPLLVHRAELERLRMWLGNHRQDRPLVLVGGLREFPPNLGRFEGVRLAAAASGRFRVAVPSLTVPPPPTYHHSRTALEPLADDQVAAAWGRFVERYGDEVGGIVLLRLSPTSPLRHDEYRRWSRWQEPLIELISATADPPVATLRLEGSGLEASLHRVPNPER